MVSAAQRSEVAGGRGACRTRWAAPARVVRRSVVEVALPCRSAAPREDTGVVAETHQLGHPRWRVVAIHRPAVVRGDVQHGLDRHAGPASPLADAVEGRRSQGLRRAAGSGVVGDDVGQGRVEVEPDLRVAPPARSDGPTRASRGRGRTRVRSGRGELALGDHPQRLRLPGAQVVGVAEIRQRVCLGAHDVVEAAQVEGVAGGAQR